MSGYRDVVGHAIYNLYISAACGQYVFEVDQAIRRAENAHPGVTLGNPVACEWHVACIAKLKLEIAIDRTVCDLVREVEALQVRAVNARAAL